MKNICVSEVKGSNFHRNKVKFIWKCESLEGWEVCGIYVVGNVIWPSAIL